MSDGVTFHEGDHNYHIEHYGIKKKSGRYPWGSGEDAEQRGRGFLSYIDEAKKSGLSESEALAAFGMNTTDLRAARTTARNEIKQAEDSA